MLEYNFSTKMFKKMTKMFLSKFRSKSAVYVLQAVESVCKYTHTRKHTHGSRCDVKAASRGNSADVQKV